MKCSYRFTTFERSEQQPLYTVKRDGTREIFSREKLLKSLVVACQKRAISSKDLESIVERVEHFCLSCEDREITSQKIGELALESLLQLDPVAYVRFASVYRAFSSPEDFISELNQLSRQAKTQIQEKIE